MAITVEEVAVQGPKLSIDKSGVARLRHYHIQGLSASIDPFFQAVTAVDAVTGKRLPRYGEADLKFPGTYCSKLDFDHFPADSRTALLVRAVFSSPEKGNIGGTGIRCRIRTANGQKLIKRWPPKAGQVLGDPILVGFHPDPAGTFKGFPARIPPSAPAQRKGGDKTLYAEVAVPVLSPGTILEFERIEKKSTLANSLKFRRTVNSAFWQGGAPGTWLMRSVDCDSEASLQRWHTHYVAEYDERAEWNNRLELFRDRDTGIVPPIIFSNIAKGNNNGYLNFTGSYRVEDFNALKLPSVL